MERIEMKNKKSVEIEEEFTKEDQHKKYRTIQKEI